MRPGARTIGAVGHSIAVTPTWAPSAWGSPEFLVLRNAVFAVMRTDLIATHLFDNVIRWGNSWTSDALVMRVTLAGPAVAMETEHQKYR